MSHHYHEEEDEQEKVLSDVERQKRDLYIKNVLTNTGEHSAHHYWSWLNSNTYLKRVMKALFESKQQKGKLSYGKVAIQIGCTKTQVHDFFSGRQRKPLTDQKIISFCNLLGIELNIKIDVKG